MLDALPAMVEKAAIGVHAPDAHSTRLNATQRL
jgi:hypothetical protein